MFLTGRFVLLLTAALGAVALAPSAGTVRLWWLLSALLAALDVAVTASPSRLSLLRADSAAVRLGASGTTRLSVRNETSRRVRGWVRDAWQPSAGAARDRHRLRLDPGGVTTLDTTLTPSRRGDRRTDRVTVRLIGPLGLAGRQQSMEVPGALRVLPAFPSRRHLPRLLSTLRQLDGRSAVRTRGQGTEFDSLRDYVAGDDVRSIDWRATARRSNVVVRTWQPERDRHVVIVVDTSRTAAARVADQPRLDAALDAAMLLSALASRAGDRVDVIAGDRTVRTRVLSAGRATLVHRVSSALAGVDPALVEADWSRLGAEVAGRARRRALVVLLTPLEPAAVEEGLLPMLEPLTRRHVVLLGSVRDPALADLTRAVATAADAYRAAAAEQALSRRDRTGAVLRLMGVHIVDEPPAGLPVAVCDLYLSLKSQGRL